MGRKIVTSHGVDDTYTILMYTWNTPLESYQLREYNNTLATVKRQIQHAENPTPAVVISMKAARFDNGILPDYLASEVALEQPEIGSTDPSIPISNNFTDDALHLVMRGSRGYYEAEGDDTDDHDAILTASWRRRPATELEIFELGTSDVDRYEGEDGYDADADDEEEASQADDGSTQNVED